MGDSVGDGGGEAHDKTIISLAATNDLSRSAAPPAAATGTSSDAATTTSRRRLAL